MSCRAVAIGLCKGAFGSSRIHLLRRTTEIYCAKILSTAGLACTTCVVRRLRVESPLSSQAQRFYTMVKFINVYKQTILV